MVATAKRTCLSHRWPTLSFSPTALALLPVAQQGQPFIAWSCTGDSDTSFWREGGACSIVYCCRKLLPKFSSLKNTCVTSRFHWVRDPGMALLGPTVEVRVLSFKGNLPFLIGCCVDATVCLCHVRLFKSRQLVSSEQTRESWGRGTTAFDNLIFLMTSYLFLSYWFIGGKTSIYLPLKGRELHKSVNTSRWESRS